MSRRNAKSGQGPRRIVLLFGLQERCGQGCQPVGSVEPAASSSRTAQSYDCVVHFYHLGLKGGLPPGCLSTRLLQWLV